MPEKRDSYQLANQSAAQTAVQEPPSQQSVDLLIRLLQEFERRSTPPGTTVPPEVKRDVGAVGTVFESIEAALVLGASPVAVSGITPPRGSANGGTRVTITGSRFLPGASVRFRDAPARDVTVVSSTEIQATTPAAIPQGDTGAVDVVVETLAGSASLASGYTYQS